MGIQIFNDDGAVALIAAVYRKAVKEDITEVKSAIKNELMNMGVKNKSYTDFIEKNSKKIEEKVKNAVYRESLNFPKNSRTKTKKTNRSIANHFLNMA